MRRTVALVLIGVMLAGCSVPPPPAPPAASPRTTPQTSTPQASTQTQAVPVYYLAATGAGPRLQREFHRVRTNDPASAAVREMLGVAAADPDYRSYWPAATALHSPVVVGADAVTVDLTAAATGAPAGGMPPDLSLQQLVFTVQGRAAVEPARPGAGGRRPGGTCAR